MVNWLKKKIIVWMRDEWGRVDVSQKICATRDVEAVSEADPILHFRVFSAVGGKVVEFRRYDRQRDRTDTQTYIITNEQDFGERIAKIATMEILKN